jgi:hypothetical protein
MIIVFSSCSLVRSVSFVTANQNESNAIANSTSAFCREEDEEVGRGSICVSPHSPTSGRANKGQRALREILEAFIEAGWPAAQHLAYRIDEIHR